MRQTRLVPRQPIYLGDSPTDIDRDYVAAVFLKTWKKIPLTGHRTILQRIKAVSWSRMRVMVAPLHDTELGAQIKHYGALMLIDTAMASVYPERRLSFAIARELARVADYTACGDVPDEPTADEAEERVAAILDAWGWDPNPAAMRPTKRDDARVRRYMKAREKKRRLPLPPYLS